jgi:methylmalonyl-CoA mutase
LATLTGSLTITDLLPTDTNLLKSLLEATEKASNFLVINILQKENLVVERNTQLLIKATKIIDALLKEGLPLESIIKKIQFSTSIYNNYFVEIAGLRALRMLFTEIVKEYGLVTYKPYQFPIQALTTLTIDEKTAKEPDWNMLSNTMQAMTAVIGGCDIITVLPHNEGISEVSNFSMRIARNVTNLLLEESYLGKSKDVAAGAYYIDMLTDKVAEGIWEKFTVGVTLS